MVMIPPKPMGCRRLRAPGLRVPVGVPSTTSRTSAPIPLRPTQVLLLPHQTDEPHSGATLLSLELNVWSLDFPLRVLNLSGGGGAHFFFLLFSPRLGKCGVGRGKPPYSIIGKLAQVSVPWLPAGGPSPSSEAMWVAKALPSQSQRLAWGLHGGPGIGGRRQAPGLECALEDKAPPWLPTPPSAG